MRIEIVSVGKGTGKGIFMADRADCLLGITGDPADLERPLRGRFITWRSIMVVETSAWPNKDCTVRDVDSSLQQMGGEAMAKGMAASLLGDASRSHRRLDLPL